MRKRRDKNRGWPFYCLFCRDSFLIADGMTEGIDPYDASEGCTILSESQIKWLAERKKAEADER